jgi:HAD superfamily hydrolase (TIGR01509 family)
MIRALIFDFDGLILDTETPDYEAWRDLYREFGQDLPIETWGQIVGGNSATSFEPEPYLEQLTGRDLSSLELRARSEARSLALINSQPPLPGVLDALNAARERGLPLAVASSSPHDWVEGHLTRLGLLDRFVAIICREDVPPGRIKPDPDLFLKTLAALRVPADEALVFEDSPNGVWAAHAAGIRVVAVPNPLTAQLPFDGEDLRLSSLADLSLGELLAKFEARDARDDSYPSSAGETLS